jgi:hypothetical protein
MTASDLLQQWNKVILSGELTPDVAILVQRIIGAKDTIIHDLERQRDRAREERNVATVALQQCQQEVARLEQRVIETGASYV